MPRSPLKDASPRSLAKAANRKTIIDAARCAFSEIGYEQSSVRDVIKRTGLAAGTFYNYFRSKEELFVAIAADHQERFVPIIEQIRLEHQSLHDKVHKIYEAYFEYVLEEIKLYGEPYTANVPLPNVMSLPPILEIVFDELHTGLARTFEAEGITGVDTEYVAAIGIGAAKEVRARFLRRKDRDPKTAALYAATFFLSGIRDIRSGSDNG